MDIFVTISEVDNKEIKNAEYLLVSIRAMEDHLIIPQVTETTFNVKAHASHHPCPQKPHSGTPP